MAPDDRHDGGGDPAADTSRDDADEPAPHGTPDDGDAPTPLLIVDGANVVGSRPDGWWRDRAGAAARLRDDLTPVARHGLPALPAPVEVVLVVEGAARRVPAVDGVRVVPAPGSGDDTIVALVADDPHRPRVVVTADRELRRRVTDLGAQVRGPRWLPRDQAYRDRSD